MANSTSSIIINSGYLSCQEWFIIAAAGIGILFGLFNAWWILKIEVVSRDEEVMALRDDKMLQKYREMENISKLIADGA